MLILKGIEQSQLHFMSEILDLIWTQKKMPKNVMLCTQSPGNFSWKSDNVFTYIICKFP